MIKRNKISIVIASLLTLAPMIIGAVIWERLTELMPTHWGFNGEADDYSSKGFTVFGMPLIFLALLWICLIVTSMDKRNKSQNPKIESIVIWIVPILSCTIAAATYCTSLGIEIMVTNIVFSTIGAVVLILGNYMPKCKQNSTIGVRLKWTLESEENWSRTHRFAGIIWFICGILLIACGFLPTKIAVFAVLPIILFSVFAPIIYSFALHKKGI